MGLKKLPLWQIWQNSNREHISLLILREYEQYVKDNDFFPNQHALFRLMTIGHYNAVTHKWEEPRYKMTIGQYNHWFDRLVAEGYIQIDGRTTSTRASWFTIAEKDEKPPELE